MGLSRSITLVTGVVAAAVVAGSCGPSSQARSSGGGRGGDAGTSGAGGARAGRGGSSNSGTEGGHVANSGRPPDGTSASGSPSESAGGDGVAQAMGGAAPAGGSDTNAGTAAGGWAGGDGEGMGGRANDGGGGEFSFAGEDPLYPDYACDVQVGEVGRVVELANGVSMLIDTFLTSQGVIVVTENRVQLVDRAAHPLAEHLWNTRIELAAFDGTVLVVNDDTQFVTYDTSLKEIGRGDLAGPCDATVMVGGHRFLCGVPATFERTFYTYDALTGALLQSSTNLIAEEGPIRGVPGRDEFVSIEGHSSPRHFFLLAVDQAGAVTTRANSSAQYHGDFRISPVYTFVGNPATHLITDQGLVLCLNPEDCPDPMFGLTLDGDVGVLPDKTYFGAMDVDPQDKLHAIYGLQTNSLLDAPLCDQGCTLERLDITSGAVEAALTVHFGLSIFVALRAVPGGGILLGCREGDYYGHRVTLLLDGP